MPFIRLFVKNLKAMLEFHLLLYYSLDMKLRILGDEVLRQRAEALVDINDETRQLVKAMFVTMDEAKGVGLAAPQIGLSQRLFVLRSDDDIDRVFINPHIIATSQETCSFEEGCLSVPQIYAEVERPEKVSVQALDEHGKPFTLDAEGYLARIIQHEYDHLEGVLFIDRLDPELKEEAEKTIARKEEKKAEREKEKARKKAKLEAAKESNR